MTALELTIHNIGGIESAEYTFEPGTTLITGENASNKTSLLKASLFALGAARTPLRSGTDEGWVELSDGDRTVKRTLRRAGTDIEIQGTGWIDDDNEITLLERFAGLLESNSLRRAVASGGRDIEQLLKEPMDIEALESERADKLERKRSLKREIGSLDSIEEELSAKERTLSNKREHIEELEEKLEGLYDRQTSETSTDDKLQSLIEKRSDLRGKEAEYTEQITTLETAIERHTRELENISADLSEIESGTETANTGDLKAERQHIREEVDDITARLETLQSVLTATREMVNSEFRGVLGYDAGLMEDEIICWTCGRPTDVSTVEETTEELADLIAEEKTRRHEYEPQLERLDEQIRQAQQTNRRREELTSERNRIQQQIEERRDSLDQRKRQLSEVRDGLEQVEADIEEREHEQQTADMELTDEIESTRMELQRARRTVERLKEQCEKLRAKRHEVETKQEELETLSNEIADLTERIDNREAELRSTFNEAINDLVDILAFQQIERVWLDGDFELVVARETDGTVHQASLDQLAESEREMIGLVLALSGFVVYDVGDVSPAIVLDSLGAFDEERTQRLVEYFADLSEYVLAAVHPESVTNAKFNTLHFEDSAILSD